MYGTPRDVIDLTGIQAKDLVPKGAENPEQALTDLLTTWLVRISAAIDVRLGEGREVRTNDSRYLGLTDVCIRTTAMMVSTAIRQRTNPIIQVNDFTIATAPTSDVIKNLDMELKPYIRKASRKAGTFSLFSSKPSKEETYLTTEYPKEEYPNG